MNRKKIRAVVIGGAGYTGGETIRLLLRHPQVDLIAVISKSQTGKPVASVHADLIGDTDLLFTDLIPDSTEVLFLCLGHGESKKFLEEHRPDPAIRIIDLSQDFRLPEHASLYGYHFVYGLPELHREKIRTATHLANPGCFATAIQLGLLPLASAGLLDEIHTTGITGSTGAGQAYAATSHFSWRASNIQAYKTLNHQHLKEINVSLRLLQHDAPVNLYFVPWRGDFTRGIFVSSMIHCELKESELTELFEIYYRDHPFTMLADEPIFLKQAVNTNKCIIQLEKVGSKLVVHSAIDNLLKGASGQAVQNMNLMFGCDEKAGLELKAGFF